MAPIQGTGEEYRSRTSCVVDRGMAYPSGFVAGSTTLSVTALAQVVGRWWDRINQLAQWLSAQQDALRQKAASDYQPARRRDGMSHPAVCPRPDSTSSHARDDARHRRENAAPQTRGSALDERLLDHEMAGLAVAALEKPARFKRLAQLFKHARAATHHDPVGVDVQRR